MKGIFLRTVSAETSRTGEVYPIIKEGQSSLKLRLVKAEREGFVTTLFSCSGSLPVKQRASHYQ